jgi:hypothetical protein
MLDNYYHYHNDRPLYPWSRDVCRPLSLYIDIDGVFPHSHAFKSRVIFNTLIGSSKSRDQHCYDGLPYMVVFKDPANQRAVRWVGSSRKTHLIQMNCCTHNINDLLWLEYLKACTDLEPSFYWHHHIFFLEREPVLLVTTSKIQFV